MDTESSSEHATEKPPLSARCWLNVGSKGRQAIELLHNLKTICQRRPRTSVYYDGTNLLELVFPLLQVKVFPDDRVFACKVYNLFPVQVVKES